MKLLTRYFQCVTFARVAILAAVAARAETWNLELQRLEPQNDRASRTLSSARGDEHLYR